VLVNIFFRERYRESVPILEDYSKSLVVRWKIKSVLLCASDFSCAVDITNIVAKSHEGTIPLFYIAKETDSSNENRKNRVEKWRMSRFCNKIIPVELVSLMASQKNGCFYESSRNSPILCCLLRKRGPGTVIFHCIAEPEKSPLVHTVTYFQWPVWKLSNFDFPGFARQAHLWTGASHCQLETGLRKTMSRDYNTLFTLFKEALKR